jgi:hypothetical protein
MNFCHTVTEYSSFADERGLPDRCLYTHSRSWALLEKPPIVQPLKNLPQFYGTRRFITVFTRALHWSSSWATQFNPHHPILSLQDPSYYCPPTYVAVFPVISFPQYPIRIPFRPHSCYILCIYHPTWLDHCNYTWRRVQVTKLLIMQFSPTSCLFIAGTIDS